MYWFLSEPYQKDAVFSRLIKMQFPYVVGLDIGHGESLAYVMDTRTLKPQKLEILDNVDKLPTMIAFREDKSPVIGKAAAKYPVFYQDFKVDPGQWNPEDREDQEEPENEALLKAFIRTLWRGIMKKNPLLETAVNSGQVLIAVGCPSSSLWTDAEPTQKYVELIQEATGCANVAVLAESTAAIMSVILDKYEVDKAPGEEELALAKNSVSLNRGLAVIDAGSSTIDFTYVFLGKKLITASLAVAGYAIDEQMLEQALENCGLTRDQIPAEQEMDILVQLRGIKEDFYPDQVDMGSRSIPIWGRNAQGETDRSVDSGLRLEFQANKAFMKSVLDRKVRRSHLSEPTSWREECEKFIGDCWALIDQKEDGGLLCDNVILTGGTSHVPMIYETAAKKYGAEKVSYSRDCASSVAKGLCFAKALEIRGWNELEQYREAAAKLAEENYSVLIRDIADYTVEGALGKISAAIQYFMKAEKKVTVGKLLDKINMHIYTDDKLTGDGCRAHLETLFKEHFGNVQQQLQEKVNEVSRNIYGTNLEQIPQIPQLSKEDLDRLIARMNISASIDSIWKNVLSSGFFISLIGGAVQGMGFMLMKDFLAGRAFQFVTDNIKKNPALVIPKKMVIPKWAMQNMYRSILDVSSRKKITKTAQEETVKALLEKSFMKDIFTACVWEQTEVLLGKVLFLVYDRKPDIQ